MDESKQTKDAPFLRRAFETAGKAIRYAGAQTAEGAAEVRRELESEIAQIRNESADFIEKHGQGRLKVGVASALKAGMASAIKVGAVTLPAAKITVPVAFVVGALFGPLMSRKVAGVLRTDPPATQGENPAPPPPPAPLP